MPAPSDSARQAAWVRLWRRLLAPPQPEPKPAPDGGREPLAKPEGRAA